MYDPVVITLLEKNVKELQGQLVNANKRIKALTDENYNLRRELGVQKMMEDKLQITLVEYG